MGMSGAGANGPGKAGGAAVNTGQPNWTSGATGNTALAPAANTAVAPGAPSGMTTAPQGDASISSGAASPATPALQGNWWEPGTDAYNQMNNLMATQPMGNLVNILQSGGLGTAGNQVLQNLLGSSGSNSWMNQSSDAFKALGGPEGTANFQNLYNAAGQPGAAQNYLGETAAGGMLKSNPYIDAMVTKGQEEAQTGLNQMFAQGGRYGSGTNQGVVADSFQDVSNKFRGEEYDRERARQMAAAGAISQEQLGRMGVQGNAAQGVGGLQTAGAQGLGGLGTSAMTNWLNAQGGAGTLANQGIENQFGAMGQLGNVQNNKMFDSTQQRGVGQEVDAATQSQINDLINQWTGGDMESWSRLGGLLSAGTGSAGNWGTQSGTSTQSSQPGWGSIVGGVLSLIGMSDRRMKTDIEPLGMALAGVPLYQFSYRADPTKSLQIGVMADEVRDIHPDAVTEIDGYDYVDYALLHERHGS